MVFRKTQSSAIVTKPNLLRWNDVRRELQYFLSLYI